jgi:transketolase
VFVGELENWYSEGAIMPEDLKQLEALTKLVRYFILKSTTAAGSGHPTSSLSAAELMVGLMFGGTFRFDFENPDSPHNDRLIFSKGHASPLYYALYAVAGKVTEEELMTLRKFGSRLEGHPMPVFPYTEAATGSLGQGLSIGAGMALSAKRFDHTDAHVYVLLGDSEMAEGSVWEAIQWAGHEKLDNLIGIIDVNRLGQSGETMLGHDVEGYERRVQAFGWETVVIDGHDMKEVIESLSHIVTVGGRPKMIIAKTVKGKGISFLENKEGWHGKALSKEELEKALNELGEVDTGLPGTVAKPNAQVQSSNPKVQNSSEIPSTTPRQAQGDTVVYKKGELIATRKAYGTALAKLALSDPRVIAIDAEVKNSTFAEAVLKQVPAQYVETYIAEQNMVGVAVGLSRRGKIPFCSTFAAFFTRAFDQIRMGAYSQANVKFCGSHAGVSIGEDGPSQMALEDLAQFRAVQGCAVLYPSDAISTEKLVIEAARHGGMAYIRTTRGATPVVYDASEEFSIGGLKVVKKSDKDVCTIIAAGITLHEALKAHEALRQEGIQVRVVDLYSIKPLDSEMLRIHAQTTRTVLTVEDHGPEGGIGEAVAAALIGLPVEFASLAVRKTPKSGKPEELLAFEEIDARAIVEKVKEII